MGGDAAGLGGHLGTSCSKQKGKWDEVQRVPTNKKTPVWGDRGFWDESERYKSDAAQRVPTKQGRQECPPHF
ncbi:hypothetical protein HNQ64_004728 [Prosthecobacter dejongeii]|uniref:Uncharacterized protein n=1 Tax=Prosthecobacter dejongeii TaxID=48465 RepID=A0A7W8DRZ9_9BACT|nr:hypothetical protein [Prosthecobacter dejongeii]